jgi:hypothetical protein
MTDLLGIAIRHAEKAGWILAEGGAYYRHGQESLLTLGFYRSTGNIVVGLMKNDADAWPGEHLYHGHDIQPACRAIDRISAVPLR